MGISPFVFFYLPQKKKRTSEKLSPRKRRFEPEAGSERRNPSRKARPKENFGVEERSASPTRGGPRTVDIRRLVEVQWRGETLVEPFPCTCDPFNSVRNVLHCAMLSVDVTGRLWSD